MDTLLIYDHILPYLGLKYQPVLNKEHHRIIKRRLYDCCKQIEQSAVSLGATVPVKVPEDYQGFPNDLIVQITTTTLNEIYHHFGQGPWGLQNNLLFNFSYWSFYERIDLEMYHRDEFYRTILDDQVCERIDVDAQVFFSVVDKLFGFEPLAFINVRPEPLDYIE